MASKSQPPDALREAAEQLERRNGETTHTCSFDWCDSVSPGTEHWQPMPYTTASLGSGADGHYSLRIGAAISYHEGVDSLPAVVIHIDGGRYEQDAQADLRVDEAIALRMALDEAITNAIEVMAAGIDVDIREIEEQRRQHLKIDRELQAIEDCDSCDQHGRVVVDGKEYLCGHEPEVY